MINIYFAEQPRREREKPYYEIYREGKPSGVFVKKREIFAMLNSSQIKSFVREDDRIFYVDEKRLNKIYNLYENKKIKFE